MSGLLREYIPDHGPPKNPEQSAPLGDDLYELRRQPKKGPKLRVIYFYDATLRRVIVVTHGFFKDQPQTPDEEIEYAKDLRAKYHAAAEREDLDVVDLAS
jgi:phage-related protein